AIVDAHGAAIPHHCLEWTPRRDSLDIGHSRNLTRSPPVLVVFDTCRHVSNTTRTQLNTTPRLRQPSTAAASGDGAVGSQCVPCDGVIAELVEDGVGVLSPERGRSCRGGGRRGEARRGSGLT